jgi:hypothetical protein
VTPRLLTLALAAAFALPAHADQANKSAPSPIANAGAATVVARPLLWKVSDADNDVYLLGSFHLLKSDDYPMPVEIDRAFDDAESLLFEVDPREMTSPETAAIMQKYMAYEDGQSLSKVLPKATLERLEYPGLRQRRFGAGARAERAVDGQPGPGARREPGDGPESRPGPGQAT